MRAVRVVGGLRARGVRGFKLRVSYKQARVLRITRALLLLVRNVLCFAALWDDPRTPLGVVREVRNEQPHREKRSSPLPFDHNKYGNCHCHQCGFL